MERLTQNKFLSGTNDKYETKKVLLLDFGTIVKYSGYVFFETKNCNYVLPLGGGQGLWFSIYRRAKFYNIPFRYSVRF